MKARTIPTTSSSCRRSLIDDDPALHFAQIGLEATDAGRRVKPGARAADGT
jgi:hypothetical protein